MNIFLLFWYYKSSTKSETHYASMKRDLGLISIQFLLYITLLLLHISLLIILFPSFPNLSIGIVMGTMFPFVALGIYLIEIKVIHIYDLYKNYKRMRVKDISSKSEVHKNLEHYNPSSFCISKQSLVIDRDGKKKYFRIPQEVSKAKVFYPKNPKMMPLRVGENSFAFYITKENYSKVEKGS